MEPIRNDPVEVDVAIVGGGAAGTLAAIRLLADSSPALVAVIEPAPALALGAAYSTPFEGHLLNVVAGRMSAFDEDPEHFVRFLERDGPPGDIRTAFVPRAWFGEYLRDTLESLPGYEALQHIRDRAIDIEPGRRQAIPLASGRLVHARAVLLACGNAPRALPPALAHAGAAIVDAWDYAALRAIDADADVCIVGSGLSMADAAVVLAAQAHRGRIHVLSRHGLMPLPHAAPEPRAGDVDDLLPMGLRAKLAAIRRRVHAATHAGEPWQWTFDRLRPHGQALWKSLSEAEQRRFLRHLARYWDIHRHRVAPQVAHALRRLRDDGQLQAHAGRLSGVDIRPDGAWDLRYAPRRAAGERTIRAHRIVNAMGLEPDVRRRADPLMAALLRRGRLRPGPHGIGVKTAGVGQVLDAAGEPDPRLLAIGALRVGDLWESVAIPELRVQARAIAAFLLRPEPRAIAE